MRSVLGFVICCLLTFAASPVLAQDHALVGTFDAAAFDRTEKRLIQTALAAAGDYRGALDGAWGSGSARALEDYARREFGTGPQNLHAAAAVLAFVEEIDLLDWEFAHFPRFGLSFARPLAAIGPAEAVDGGLRWTGTAADLTILVERQDDPTAAAWHDAGRQARDTTQPVNASRGADRMTTAGTLSDGRRFHLRSDRLDGGWSSVSILFAPHAAPIADLVAMSVQPGRAEAWDLPVTGALARLVADALVQMAQGRTGTDDASQTITDAFVDARLTGDFDADASRADGTLDGYESGFQGETFGDGFGAAGSGTGFYVGPHALVTAGHVIAGCARVTLQDGSALAVLGSDAVLDVAVLRVVEPSPVWLSLPKAEPVRLGQRVHAAGYPYYNLAGTQLNLTGGNVSALAGIDDDARFFSFSAPVQPGNSGGPLIGNAGDVVGLVVSRLSESFIAEATGTLPQNVNYALGSAGLMRFLNDLGIDPEAGSLSSFTLDDGAPAAIATAIVPILCD